MWAFLRAKLPEVLRAMAPLLLVVGVLQLTVVQAPLPQFLQFLAGSVLAVLGMLLLFAGVEHGILPMGRYIGAELPRKGSLWLIVAVAAALGFVTTVAEPDVIPRLIPEFQGSKKVPPIADAEYDPLYVVTIPWYGKVKTLRLHYGARYRPAPDPLPDAESAESADTPVEAG